MITTLAILYVVIAAFAVVMTVNEGAAGNRPARMRALGIVGSVLWPLTLLALIASARLRRPAKAAMGSAATA